MVSYVKDLLLFMLLVSPVYTILRIYYLRWKKRRIFSSAEEDQSVLQEKADSVAYFPREIALGVFVLFMVGLFVFVSAGSYLSPMQMGKYAAERVRTHWGMNFVPFRTIKSYYRTYHLMGDLFLVNVVGNVVMFIPWGFSMPFFWKKNRKILRMMLFTLLLPICVEFMQLFIGRSVDIDDVILNFLGGMIGCGICLLVTKCFPNLKKMAR